ncbi:MAG: VWA domain-containing protein [Gemmatimonadales bacterium]
MARGLVRWRERLSEERGAILVFVAVSLVGIIGFSGLAIDLGRGYVTKVRLSRAVDAAAIEAAYNVRLGQTKAEQIGRSVAALNGIVDGAGGTSLSLSFDIMGAQGAWGDLQAAADQFVRYFDDSLDQLGLVHFQIRANDAFDIDGLFTTSITNAIQSMNSAGDTNTGEGLRLALKQMKSKVIRPRSAKVVVFFTDGRPTAFRDNINGQERVIAVRRILTGNVRGLFDDPDNLPMSQVATADDCDMVPVCYGWTEATVRAEARQKGLLWADKIRSQGIVLYTIGLGNPSASDPIETPDIGYLEQLANVGGIVDASQPHGRSYFAPSPSELQDAFSQVARDLLVRLAK